MLHRANKGESQDSNLSSQNETEEVSRKWNTRGIGEVYLHMMLVVLPLGARLGARSQRRNTNPESKIALGRVNMNAVIQVFPLKEYLSQVDRGVSHLVLLPSSNQKIYMTNDNARG